MATKSNLVAQNPLILRCHRLMEAFAKSDDERDFYIDRQEGFLLYADLDKSQDELDEFEKELAQDSERYCQIPKLTFYEIKKVMEGFVNEKVYDIDTKEKLLDIIQSKEARENFLEFIYDHHSELEKWQQYYQERFRVRIIEWLRNTQFDFVFEEDLELTKSMVEKLKMNTFVPKVSKDIMAARKILVAKAKTYYSNEALNPRPKRGRPPKQVAKVEAEPQFSQDIYTTIPKAVKPFLFVPDYHSSSAIFTFSGKFTSEAELLAHRRQQIQGNINFDLQSLGQKLAAIRTLSATWNMSEQEPLLAAANPSYRKPNGATPFINGDSTPFDDHYRNYKAPSILPVASDDEYLKSSPKRVEKPTKSSKKDTSSAIPTKGSSKSEAKEKGAKAPKSAKKESSAKAQAPKSTNGKARLRPLKRANEKPAAKEKKTVAKGKNSQLRMLRRAKKK